MENKKRSPSDIGRASRNKGKAGEREAAKALMERIPGVKIERSVQYSGRGAARGSGGMPDLVGLKPFHLEVKRTEKAEPYKWLTQVQSDKLPSELGVVLHRQSRKGWIAIMDLDDFCKLVNMRKNE